MMGHMSFLFFFILRKGNNLRVHQSSEHAIFIRKIEKILHRLHLRSAAEGGVCGEFFSIFRMKMACFGALWITFES